MTVEMNEASVHTTQQQYLIILFKYFVYYKYKFISTF